ncbi:hypothetical protein [Oceanicaulis sp.]|uniref:hypothetical protein n=1 Tax=Oceanicaulis sp. TaxID=1924941 RepID=UPI003F72F539
MKLSIVSSVLLMTLILSACAGSPQTIPIARINCAEGVPLKAVEPGERPRLIQPGEDWRDYGEGLFAKAEELHARLSVAHGALVSCDREVAGEEGG